MVFGGLCASPGLPCAQADLDHVASIVTRSGTSFGRGMKVLPQARRQGMFAVYAFCREVDDIADGDAGVTDPAHSLAEWHQRIKYLFEGEARNALDRVLVATIMRFALKAQDFHDVIDGMIMDCGAPIVAPDEKTLDLYCDRVASAVGRLSVCVFGDTSPEARKVAYHLGRALQITNILRDLGEDAQRGRLYLPTELLERFDVPTVPTEALYAHGLDPVCRVLARRAQDHFRDAHHAMRLCKAKAMRPARMMAASYQPVLSALLKRGWKNPDQTLDVSKAWRATRAFIAYVK
ncbi:presqualene diphosphate synthase HpnD [Neokomagataea thailandica]|uniref:Phytoene synthase n=1 Tax=Neokomagataea tanensis NBRC 106556 TaxID=1223519 RepID=A0ABQ0QJX7_9PROT|nr:MULTISPECIES: presqualene diphosphate synthase HpnD [Neokomagataea]GBR47481.1 phytoene synthase [Neokomagataea tanensis NBRC 106556]